VIQKYLRMNEDKELQNEFLNAEVKDLIDMKNSLKKHVRDEEIERV
jgi:hypothetical protein